MELKADTWAEIPEGKFVYHVTKGMFLDEIEDKGLRTSADMPVVQEAKQEAEASDMEFREPMKTPPEELAQRDMDDVLSQAQYSREEWKKYPSHESHSAVFFWTRKREAKYAAKKRGGGSTVLIVDPTRIPCDCAVGDVTETDEMFNMYYNTYKTGGGGMVDRDKVFDLAESFWEGVRWYNGEYGSDLEMWCPCDIPPEAFLANMRFEQRV